MDSQHLAEMDKHFVGVLLVQDNRIVDIDENSVIENVEDMGDSVENADRDWVELEHKCIEAVDNFLAITFLCLIEFYVSFFLVFDNIDELCLFQFRVWFF